MHAKKELKLMLMRCRGFLVCRQAQDFYPEEGPKDKAGAGQQDQAALTH